MDDGFRGLTLTNTLTRRKEAFRPLDWSPDSGVTEAERRVRMYVCGPTVYDFAHIGNARPVIVFDVLFRLLRHLYGEAHVTYARNITDVDDKINARAARDFPGLPLNEAIARVTQKTAAQFHEDVAALGCLPPTVEPRATAFVTPRADGLPDMVSMIETLIAKGHAYVAGGEVLFDVASMPAYGALSRRRLDEQQAGARVAVEAHKKNPADFVLWKLSSENEPGWDSPWGRGRPGWHIECSVMSEAYLGQVFDIHGGGLDLIFPHHENEIAQSCCAHGTSQMAQVWMHNGFVQVEGRKMSKSEGNFLTIADVLHTEKVGGRRWSGSIVRLMMMMTHYREPIDFSVRRLEEARNRLSRWRSRSAMLMEHAYAAPEGELINSLCDDLNIAQALSRLDHLMAQPLTDDNKMAVAANLRFLGLQQSAEEGIGVAKKVSALVEERDRNYGGPLASIEEIDAVAAVRARVDIATFISDRLEKLKAKDFAAADAIRDDLAAQGIQLKDGKDPATGERVTTWELKR
ncbi:cysteine--tRNA ligase [Aureimonas mangrovi]|uniref:cysteine--tRNA ligase n=1 Tax=Aureimonas mangrovi TaxID=2758041 RepID=UPI001FE90631|nr:cysteine--tRNA ligase [Aureimonas mangrovi]